MQVNQVGGIVSKIGATPSGKSPGGDGFAGILSEAIGNAKQTDAGAQMENISLLTGEADDLHSPVIAAQKAELALSLAIQVRNKVLEAYNDVMRMQL